LVWRAKHTGPTAFLGHQLDWRADHRLVVSDELTRHGHRVEHVVAPDTSEVHQKMAEVPYFILQEEKQLKKLEASRKSGERPPVRSKTDRSTEAVVRSLATQKASVDVGAELRDAENQTDLNRIQKRMVRLQVAQSKKEGGLASKELTSLPSYIVAEAQEKLASHEVKKAAYEARKKAVEIDPMSKSSASSAQPDPSHALLVASDSAASSSSHHVAPTLASAREGIAAVSEATSTRSSTWRTARLARALNCSDGGEEDAGQSELPENLTAPEAASSAVSGLPPGGAVGRESRMVQQTAERKEQMMRPELFSSLRSQNALCRGPSSRRSRWSGVKRMDDPADGRTERADDEGLPPDGAVGRESKERMVQQIAEQKEQMMRAFLQAEPLGLPPGGAVGRESKERMVQQIAEQKEQMMRAFLQAEPLVVCPDSISIDVDFASQVDCFRLWPLRFSLPAMGCSPSKTAAAAKVEEPSASTLLQTTQGGAKVEEPQMHEPQQEELQQEEPSITEVKPEERPADSFWMGCCAAN
ncbi:unnamed protein product, partial [Polarella glacialis]